jgi:hypothetical protein
MIFIFMISKLGILHKYSEPDRKAIDKKVFLALNEDESGTGYIAAKPLFKLTNMAPNGGFFRVFGQSPKIYFFRGKKLSVSHFLISI